MLLSEIFHERRHRADIYGQVMAQYCLLDQVKDGYLQKATEEGTRYLIEVTKIRANEVQSQYMEYLEQYRGGRSEAEVIVSWSQLIQERDDDILMRLEDSISTVWEPVEINSILKG